MLRLFGFTLGLLFLAGCSLPFQKWQYNSAVRKAERQDYDQAVRLFSRVIRRLPESSLALSASRRASRLAVFELKNYESATEFYKHLILYSPDGDERLASQKALADLYFEKLQNYDQAIVEYSRLIPLLPPDLRPNYKLVMARAYFYLNNVAQAEIEVDDLLSKQIERGLKFDALLFKSSLLQAGKRTVDAIKVFEEMIKSFPERSKRENIGLSMAVSYEELGELNKSIETLELIKNDYPTPDFIEVRINRLKERLANLPGAQGLKK